MRHQPGFSRLVLLPFPVALAVFTAAFLGTGERSFGAEGVGVVKGVVVDAGGKPVAGAQVQAFPNSPYVPMDVLGPALDVLTDAKGRFEAQLAAGEYVACVTKGLLTVGRAQHGLRVWEVEGAKTLELRIPLRKGGRIEGVVVRKEGDTPVVSATVALGLGPATATDAQGRFALDGVEFGENTLAVTAPGLADKRVELDTTGQAVSEVRVEMLPGFTLRGRVVDEQGRPVAGACVRRVGGGWPVHTGMMARLTDREGHFVLPGFPRERKEEAVWVHHRDFGTFSSNFAMPAESETTAPDIVLRRGKAVEGDVRGPDGKPLAGALVCHGSLMDGDPHARTRTDGRGFFRLDGLCCGSETTILVVAKGCAPASQSVEFAAGGPVPKLSFTLTPGKKAWGRVLDRKGRPIAGASIVVGRGPGGT